MRCSAAMRRAGGEHSRSATSTPSGVKRFLDRVLDADSRKPLFGRIDNAVRRQGFHVLSMKPESRSKEADRPALLIRSEESTSTR